MNDRDKDIQYNLRPDQGGDILTEFALEVIFPIVFAVILATIAFFMIIL